MSNTSTRCPLSPQATQTRLNHDMGDENAECLDAGMIDHPDDAGTAVILPAPMGPNGFDKTPGLEDRVTRQARHFSHHESEPSQEMKLFRVGKKLNRPARYALKGHMLSRLKALPRVHPKMLKALHGCGSARPTGVTACRTSINGKVTSGFLDGVFRCRRRLCPVCGYGMAVRRFHELMDRADVIKKKFPDAAHVTGAITCEHHVGEDPRAIFDALSAAWDEWMKQDWVTGRRRRCRNGQIVQVIDRTVLGFVVCPEDTFGANGHHPHLQFLISLNLPPGLTADDRTGRILAFGDLAAEWFMKNAHRWGLVCNWNPKWWQELKSSKDAACWYLLKGAKTVEITEGEAPSELVRGASEATMGTIKETRKGQSQWEMPIAEYARLWDSTQNMRWYRVGGVWRKPGKKGRRGGKTDKALEPDPIAVISPEGWRALSPQVRTVLASVNEDIRHSRDTVFLLWDAALFLSASGMPQPAVRETLLHLLDAAKGSTADSSTSSTSSTS